jgi:hypothetical protein
MLVCIHSHRKSLYVYPFRCLIPSWLLSSLVPVQVNEVSVPTYVISRSPIGNWGFMLENCWAIYFSWEIPVKGKCLDLEDDALKVCDVHMPIYVSVYPSVCACMRESRCVYT